MDFMLGGGCNEWKFLCGWRQFLHEGKDKLIVNYNCHIINNHM